MARRVVSSEEITLAECPSPGGNRPRRRPQPTRSSPRARSESPNVHVKRDPSGDVHITVKVSEVLGGRSRSPASPISDSSYMSPPANLTPSQQQLLDGLLCQVNKRAIGDEMKTYINKLLNMSRESIDELHGPRSRSPRSASPDKDKDIERDLIRLGELAEVYAQKVNTLVDMYEQMSPDSSGSYIDPIRAPPSRTPPSSGPRAATSGVTPPPCPRTLEIPAGPTAGPCSTPRSSGYGRISQPRYIPRPRLWTPEEIQESVYRYHHPERPRTPTPTYIPSFPIPCRPWGSPHIPPLAPPYSAGSRIPIAGGRTPQRAYCPPPPPPPPQPYCRPLTPLRRPPQPMVHHPIQRRPHRVEPVTPPGRDQSPVNNCPQVRFAGESQTPSVRQRLNTIRESPEDRYESRSSISSTDTVNLFGGIPGVRTPTRQEVDDISAYCPSGSRVPDNWNMEAAFDQAYERVQQAGQGPSSSGATSAAGGSTCPPGSFPFGDDGAGFGDFGGGQDDWGDMGFGNEEFNLGIDAVLQEEARSEDHVDYPEDFPPPTDVFGPGFDWDAANLDQPSFPTSFPGDPLAGHSMSSGGESFKLDTSFDTSALQGPVNPERLNAIRQKLSNICSDQYREIIEMLQEDASQHQMKFDSLLRRATSDPFLDPNATLAPISCPETSYPGPQYATTLGSPLSPGFRTTGRTPPHDKRIQGSPGSPVSPQRSGPCPATSSSPRSGPCPATSTPLRSGPCPATPLSPRSGPCPATPSPPRSQPCPATPSSPRSVPCPTTPASLTSGSYPADTPTSFEHNLDFSDFDDPYSNINNLMSLVQNQQERHC